MEGGITLFANNCYITLVWDAGVWMQILSCGWTPKPSIDTVNSETFSSQLPNHAYLCVIGTSPSSWSVTVTGCEEDLL